jgi:uncharacterized membrane protein YbhN (UPF0104 family)
VTLKLPRPRRHIDRCAAELAALIAVAVLLDLAAGTGLAYMAGFARVLAVLKHVHWQWLVVALGALCVSFTGYYLAYRGVYGARGGYRLPHRKLLAVVAAGFGGFLAHGGRTPDDLALQAAGADRREVFVRVSTLGGMEQGVLALGGCVAAIVVLCLRLHVPFGVTMPWAIIPVPGFVLAFVAAEFWTGRLRGRGGWRERVSIFLDSVRLVRQLITRPVRYRPALAGMIAFWAADAFAAWAALAAFGLSMEAAAMLVGFCTGMLFTRRMAPLAGAGILTAALAMAIWWSGAPLAVAVAGIFVYRMFSLWLPMPFALASLPVLRGLGVVTAQSAVAQSTS